MTLTASRHHRCSIALTMLLVWVFALLSGVANACLTEPRDEPAHAGTHAPPANDATRFDATDQAQHDQPRDKAPCQKSCDATSQTLQKQLPKFDTPELQALVPPPHRQASDLYRSPSTLVRAVVAAVPPPAPPPRVQVSRRAR